MRSLRAIAPLALGATLLGLAIVPQAATTSAAEPIVADHAPTAYAVGGDAGPPVYPSIVNVRLVRAEAQLERAATAVDQGLQDQANAEITSLKSNMAKAWSAAQYVIMTTPPPAADAPASGFASPEETAAAVIQLQHDVVTTGLGILDVATEPLATTLRYTISGAINARKSAIAYIHSIAPPPVAGDDQVHAAASGAPIAAGWGTVMPAIVPFINDEIQQDRGMPAWAMIASDPNYLPRIQLRMVSTRNTINLYWPPLPPDD